MRDWAHQTRDPEDSWFFYSHSYAEDLHERLSQHVDLFVHAPDVPRSCARFCAVGGGTRRSSREVGCLLRLDPHDSLARILRSPTTVAAVSRSRSRSRSRCIFAHRHLVLLVVSTGDPLIRAKRARAYVVAPLVALTLVSLAFASRSLALRSAVFLALGGWNIWHVVKQRYGLFRIYAARAGGGLEFGDGTRRSRAFLGAGTLHGRAWS